MGSQLPIDPRAAASALIDWWSLAGADWFVMDEPGRAEPERPASATSRPAVAAVRRTAATARRPVAPADPATPLPDNLEEFRAALATPGLLPGTNLGGRAVAPRGPDRAPLMLVTDMPEPEDAASGRLLSGQAGARTDAMLRAAGFDPDGVYVASLAASRPPGGGLDPATLAGLARLTCHHIALAQPQRLLFLGSTVWEALFGAGRPPGAGSLPDINQQGGIPMAGIRHPRTFGQSWQGKRDAWRKLLTMTRDQDRT